jgi:predicted nucleic acid-binding protein
MFDLWTTAEVFTEFLAICSPLGPRSRQRAVHVVRRILADPGITVLPQTHESCLEGLTRSEQRPNKHYSLTDGIAMNVMRRRGLTEVLSYDHHVAQEGFQWLFRSRVRGMNSPTGRSSPSRARLQPSSTCP